MKKCQRITALIVSMIMMISLFTAIPVSAANVNLTVKVDGEVMHFPDQKPAVKNNRTLVPVRFVAEELGYKVEWNQKEGAAVIDNGRIKLYVNTNKAVIDGKEVTLDVKTEVINERTMVPLRFVAENLNCTVDWVPTNSMILVNKRDANGKELSVFDRFIQTDLFWVVEQSDETELIYKANYTEEEAKSPYVYHAWDINRGTDEARKTQTYPENNCTINIRILEKKYIDQVAELLYILYPTTQSEAYDIMMQVVREQLWECSYKFSDKIMYLTVGEGKGPGTFGTHYLDNRHVEMYRDYNCTRLDIIVSDEGFVYPYTPRELTAEEIAFKIDRCYPWDVFFGDK